MTDLGSAHDDSGDGQHGGDGESSVIRDLRKQNKDLNTELKELREFRKTTVFEKAGFPIKKNEDGVPTGVGSLLAEAYDGELSVDAVREFASERGIDPPAASDSSGGDNGAAAQGQTAGSLPEGDQQRLAATQHIQQIQAASLPDVDETDPRKVQQEALEAGDLDKFDQSATAQVVADLKGR